MRKFLMVVAVGALAFLMAAPAMAVDFKFGSLYRVRFYDYGNYGFDSTGGGSNPRGAQIRIQPVFDSSDDNGNIAGHLLMSVTGSEFGAGGGSSGQNLGVVSGGGAGVSYGSTASGTRVGETAGGGAGGRGVNVSTRQAYLDFAMPFGVPLRVRAGIQPWYLPKGIITDDNYAGVRAYGTVAPISYEAWWWRLNRGGSTAVPSSTVFAPTKSGGANTLVAVTGAPNTSTVKDNAFDFYGGKIDFAVAKVFNPYLYYAYGDNRSVCDGSADLGQFTPTVSGAFSDCAVNSRVRSQHYAGVGAVGDFGFMSYDIDFVYGAAKGGPTGNLVSVVDGAPLDVRGWVLDGGIHIPIGPVRWNIVASYASGDKQDTSGHKSNAYPGGPGPSWDGPSDVLGGQYELIGGGGAFDVKAIQDTPTGLWTIGTSAEYNPVKALTLRAQYLFAGFTNKKSNCANFVPGSIGCFGPAYTGKGFTALGTTSTLGANGQTAIAAGAGGLAGKSTLGSEIGFRADYLVWTGFKIQTFVGWLIPSKGDTTGKYILQFAYNF